MKILALTFNILVISLSAATFAVEGTSWNNTSTNKVILAPGQDKKTLVRWPQVDEIRDCDSHEFVCHGDVVTKDGKSKHIYCMGNEGGCPNAADCEDAMPKARYNSSNETTFSLDTVKVGVQTSVPTE